MDNIEVGIAGWRICTRTYCVVISAALNFEYEVRPDGVARGG